MNFYVLNSECCGMYLFYNKNRCQPKYVYVYILWIYIIWNQIYKNITKYSYFRFISNFIIYFHFDNSICSLALIKPILKLLLWVSIICFVWVQLKNLVNILGITYLGRHLDLLDNVWFWKFSSLVVLLAALNSWNGNIGRFWHFSWALWITFTDHLWCLLLVWLLFWIFVQFLIQNFQVIQDNLFH